MSCLFSITLRAPRFARRRREEVQADTLHRLRATTNKVALRARNARAERAIKQGIARRRTEPGWRRSVSLCERSEPWIRGEPFFPLRATTAAADSTGDARAASQ
jgi:hypothetical protein